VISAAVFPFGGGYALPKGRILSYYQPRSGKTLTRRLPARLLLFQVLARFFFKKTGQVNRASKQGIVRKD
jgi:hypothetical protein